MYGSLSFFCVWRSIRKLRELQQQYWSRETPVPFQYVDTPTTQPFPLTFSSHLPALAFCSTFKQTPHTQRHKVTECSLFYPFRCSSLGPVLAKEEKWRSSGDRIGGKCTGSGQPDVPVPSRPCVPVRINAPFAQTMQNAGSGQTARACTEYRTTTRF